MTGGPLEETRKEADEKQVAASDPALSVWVSANAGTGKTRVLTNRIIRLLLAGTRPEQILCLTFTKAAATEMANRLAAQLGRWAVMDDAALAADYRKSTGVPLDPDHLAEARRLFARVADTPDGLKIRTIHAFCESLLARFPLEAEVAPHFSVMDERTAAELRGEARDGMLRRAAGEPDGVLAAAMAHLAGLVNEDDFDALMADLDANRGRLRRLLARHEGADGVAAVVRAQLGLAADDDRASVIAGGRAGVEGGALNRAAGALAQGSKTDQGRAAEIKAWLAVPVAEHAARFDAYAAIFLTQKGEPRARLATNKVVEAEPAVAEFLAEEQARVLAVAGRLKALAVADNTAALLRLAEGLFDAYEATKAARALMDYDDLILKALALLAPDGPGRDRAIGWVHYKLDGGIAHVLVDEAQDTSPEQWDIIKALAEEFFSGQGAWDAEARGPRTVFAVGDEKQSIYSFQGADPAGFDETRAWFAERARAAGMEARALDTPVEMGVSFRSTWAVLKAVDEAFAPDELRRALSPAERAIRHLAFRDGDAGVVELWPTVTPADDTGDDPWDLPLDRPGHRAPVVRVAETIADTIKGWIDNQEPLAALGRPVRPGDIMILVRKRGRFVEEMVRALKNRDVAVAGTDRMVLTEQIAVMDLMALGNFVLLPEDDLTLATVLKGPLFNFDDDADLVALCHPRTGTLWDELRRRRGEQAHWTAAAERLEGLLAAADYAPPYEFYAALLGPGGGRREIVRRLGPDALDPLEEFLALALQFEREHVPSLQGFLHWIAAGKTEIKRDLEHGGDKVRVMTVHGAKGLEAPIVFLPDTCTIGGQGKGARLLWDDEVLYWPVRKDDDAPETRDLRDAGDAARLEEERRLLYVAMTRAKDRLYVCGWENKRGRAEGCWHELVEAALDRLGAAEADTPLGPGRRIEMPQTAAVEPPAAGAEEAVRPAPDWIHRPPPPEPAPPVPLAPSKPEEDPPVASPLGADDGRRFKRGTIVHRLLQSLPDLPPEARRGAGERYLARPGHGLEPEEQRDILAETLAVLEDPEHAALFGPGSRAEVPLVGVVDGRPISARLDRLLVTDRAVTIVDFKTNRPPPARAEDVSPVYLRQMARYRAALAGLYPDRPIRAVLLWTDGARLMALPDGLLDSP